MEDDDLISKTRRKKEMHDIQNLGVELSRLSLDQLARFKLPETLHDAIVEVKRFTRHEAIRRQMQYIGRIMRDIDVSPIAEQLAELKAPSRKQTAVFHLAEKWRTEFLGDSRRIQQFVQDYPAADAKRLLALTEAARAEQAEGRSPKQFRLLFHAINAVLQEQARQEP